METTTKRGLIPVRDIPQLTLRMPGFSYPWHFRNLPFHENLGPTAVLDRCPAGAGDAVRVATFRIECALALETNIKEPSVEEVVLVGETLI